MDNAFCVEKGGWRRGVGWKDCLHGSRRAAGLDLHSVEEDWNRVRSAVRKREEQSSASTTGTG